MGSHERKGSFWHFPRSEGRCQAQQRRPVRHSLLGEISGLHWRKRVSVEKHEMTERAGESYERPGLKQHSGQFRRDPKKILESILLCYHRRWSEV